MKRQYLRAKNYSIYNTKKRHINIIIILNSKKKQPPFCRRAHLARHQAISSDIKLLVFSTAVVWATPGVWPSYVQLLHVTLTFEEIYVSRSSSYVLVALRDAYII